MTTAYGTGSGGGGHTEPLSLGRGRSISHEGFTPETIQFRPKRQKSGPEATDAQGQEEAEVVEVIFDRYQHPADHEGLYGIFKQVIDEGDTYPQESITPAEFDGYFIGHDAYVFRLRASGEVIGGFYVKPNFPGRCGHIANGGILVRVDWRGRGLGHYVFDRMLAAAVRLGYQSFYSNLVFATNPASNRLCELNGLVRVGRLPEAARLRSSPPGVLVDAYQYYKKLAAAAAAEDK